MAKKISSEIAVARLQTAAGVNVITPLVLPDVVWINVSETVLAKQLARAWQKSWLDQGDYLSLLRHLVAADYWQETLAVPLAASKEKCLYPAHNVRLAMICMPLDDDVILGFIPALGVEVTAADSGELKRAAVKNAQLEFVRRQRLADTRRLIEVSWFDALSIDKTSVDFSLYSPAELEDINQFKEKPLLSDVAAEIYPTADEVIGLDDELGQLGDKLREPLRQSVLLVGEHGSGKTALLNSYAAKRRRARQKALWETSAASLVQGLSKDSGWQKNLALLCRELRKNEEILYANHLHELFEVGQYAGNNLSIGEALKEPLRRGEIILIGEATEAELARIDARCPGFSALFSHIRMRPKSDAENKRIARQATAAIARRNKVTLDEAAVDEIIRLQKRYMPYSGFPGRTIRFLEALLLHEVNREDFQPAAAIDRDRAVAAFCRESAMPVAIIDENAPFDALACRDFFRSRLFGQDHVIDAVVDLLVAIKTGMLRSGRPIANLLFVGPTGVGKTELAKTLAEFMFASPRRVLRLDMSEYADAGAVLRLTGDAGHDDASLVTRIRQQPFSVVLFDELEKAHANFFDLLLQILGEGRLTDSRGQLANFCSAIVIMTSNVGVEGFNKAEIGFNKQRQVRHVVRHFEQAVQDYFRPELFNRLDQVIPFYPLATALQPKIIERQLMLLSRRAGLQEREITIDIAGSAKRFLGSEGYDERYGARQMKRTLHQHLVVPLARQLNQYEGAVPLQIRIDCSGREVTVQARAQNRKPRLQAAGIHAYAERIAAWRRQLQAVREGPGYITLLSRLDQLEALKRRQGKFFWQQAGQAREFRLLGKMRQQCDDSLQALLDIETASTLALVGRSAVCDEQRAADWYESYVLLKQQLFMSVYPQARFCALGIYGALPVLQELRAFYLRLCQGVGFEAKSKAVLLHGETYRRENYPRPKSAPRQNGRLIGFELAISGACPFLFFGDETGMLRCYSDTGNRDDFYIRAANCDIDACATPENVHRKRFFDEMQPRRTIKAGKLNDKRYNITLSFTDSAELLDFLRQRALQKLDAELLGEGM